MYYCKQTFTSVNDQQINLWCITPISCALSSRCIASSNKVRIGSWLSVVTCYVDPKYKMSTLVSDCLTHFQLLKNSWWDLLQTLHTFFLVGSRICVVTFYVEQKSKMAALDSLNNYCLFRELSGVYDYFHGHCLRHF